MMGSNREKKNNFKMYQILFRILLVFIRLWCMSTLLKMLDVVSLDVRPITFNNQLKVFLSNKKYISQSKNARHIL